MSASRRWSFLGGYSSLLASSEVRHLVIGSMVARLPGAMLPLALLLLVHERTGSLASAGFVVGAYGIGRATVSPAVGALVDRLGQARVLVVGAVAQAILLIALATGAATHLTLAILAVVALAAGASTPPIQACLRALWSVVAAEGSRRETAYAFDATSQEMIWIVGPLLVAAILTVGSATAAVIVCAVIGCAGVLMFASSPISRAWKGSGDIQRFRLRALAGRDLRRLIAISAFTGASWGALTFGLTALAVESGNSRASGLLLAGVSIGSIGGGLLYGAWRWEWPILARYRALLAVNIAFGVPLLFARSVFAAIPMSLLAGVPLAPIYGSSYVLTGRSAPVGTTTEAFTWTSSAFALGVSVGTAIGGVAGQAVDVHAAFALSCGASAAAWLIASFVRRTSASPCEVGREIVTKRV